jgi:hypothetical protein
MELFDVRNQVAMDIQIQGIVVKRVKFDSLEEVLLEAPPATADTRGLIEADCAKSNCQAENLVEQLDRKAGHRQGKQSG